MFDIGSRFSGLGKRLGTVEGQESADKGVPKPLNLRLSILRRRGVIYHKIGPPPFDLQTFLGGLASLEFLLAPAP
jgi:hypothetical protein